jgi:hypothetical protein
MNNSTAYVRKFRARQREGRLLLPRIEIDNSFVDDLVEAGYLEEWSTEDPQAVAEAVLKLLRSLRGNDLPEN